MARVFIGVGSNIAPEVNIRTAIRLLARRVRIVAISTFYRTEAEGAPGPPFINGVVEVETDIRPDALKRDVLRPIEEVLGRKRTADKYAPRKIDLDILAYDGLALMTDDVVIPDPLIEERAFLAVPLAELAPDMTLPGLRRPMREVALAHAGHRMKPLPDLTNSLKRDAQDSGRESK